GGGGGGEGGGGGGPGGARAAVGAGGGPPPVRTLARPIGRAHLPPTAVVFRIVSVPGWERLHRDGGVEDDEDEDEEEMAEDGAPDEASDGGTGISFRVVDGGGIATGQGTTPDGGTRSRHLLGAAEGRWSASGRRPGL